MAARATPCRPRSVARQPSTWCRVTKLQRTMKASRNPVFSWASTAARSAPRRWTLTCWTRSTSCTSAATTRTAWVTRSKKVATGSRATKVRAWNVTSAAAKCSSRPVASASSSVAPTRHARTPASCSRAVRRRHRRWTRWRCRSSSARRWTTPTCCVTALRGCSWRPVSSRKTARPVHRW
ncbi:hypothetical protein D3C76_1024730 [compost metagenome]